MHLSPGIGCSIPTTVLYKEMYLHFTGILNRDTIESTSTITSSNPASAAKIQTDYQGKLYKIAPVRPHHTRPLPLFSILQLQALKLLPVPDCSTPITLLSTEIYLQFTGTRNRNAIVNTSVITTPNPAPAASLQPVSYTHLTLPTIYSV